VIRVPEPIASIGLFDAGVTVLHEQLVEVLELPLETFA